MAVTSLSQCREADPSTGKTTALHFPIPALEKGCSSTYASASVGIILQRPFLTPVRPALAVIKKWAIHHLLASELELLMAQLRYF